MEALKMKMASLEVTPDVVHSKEYLKTKSDAYIANFVRVPDSDEEISKLRKLLQDSKLQNSILESKLADSVPKNLFEELENELQVTRTSSDRLSKTIREKEQEIKQLVTIEQQLTKEKDTILFKNQNVNQNLKTLKAENEDLLKSNLESKSKLDTLILQEEKNSSLLETAKNTISRLELRIEELESQSKISERRMQQNVKDTGKLQESKTQEIERLRDQVIRLTSELDSKSTYLKTNFRLLHMYISREQKKSLENSAEKNESKSSRLQKMDHGLLVQMNTKLQILLEEQVLKNVQLQEDVTKLAALKK